MILITAATPWEAGPLRKRWGLEPSAPRLWRGAVGKEPLALLETGMGAARSREALEAAAALAPRLVVSTGFSGALQPGVRSGDLVVDLREAPVEWVVSARELAAAQRSPLHFGAFHSADRVLDPAAKGAAGRELRAVAVDMESAAVRAWCAGRGAEFAGVRAVFDALDERPPEGEPPGDAPGEALRWALARWKDLPALAVAWRRQVRGMRTLGAFLDAWLRTT